MTAPLITTENILALRPCWITDDPVGGAARIRRIVGAGLTGAQIADLHVTETDRRWVLCHLITRGPRPDRQSLALLLCGWAQDRAQTLPDCDLRDAIELLIAQVAAWTEGAATVDDVTDARDRMWDAAYADADAATAYAAADAAYAAAYADAAYAAAYAAYAAAYADAAYAAAYAAYADERQSRLRQLAAILDRPVGA